MAQIGTQERRDAMATALWMRGYVAAADRCRSDPKSEEHYAMMLGSCTPELTDDERRAIYPWNFEEE